MNDYDRHIFLTLQSVGRKGLQTKKLALHVFNATNNLFDKEDFDSVYNYVKLFIRRNSTNSKRIILHADRHGCYRLNLRSKYTQDILQQLNTTD